MWLVQLKSVPRQESAGRGESSEKQAHSKGPSPSAVLTTDHFKIKESWPVSDKAPEKTFQSHQKPKERRVCVCVHVFKKKIN